MPISFNSNITKFKIIKIKTEYLNIFLIFSYLFDSSVDISFLIISFRSDQSVQEMKDIKEDELPFLSAIIAAIINIKIIINKKFKRINESRITEFVYPTF